MTGRPTPRSLPDWVRYVEKRLDRERVEGVAHRLQTTVLDLGTDPSGWGDFWRSPDWTQPDTPAPYNHGQQKCVTWRAGASQYQRFGFGEFPAVAGPLTFTVTVDSTVDVDAEFSIVWGDNQDADFFKPGITVVSTPQVTRLTKGGPRTYTATLDVPSAATKVQPYLTLFTSPASGATGTTCAYDAKASITAPAPGTLGDFIWLAQSGTPDIPNNVNPHVVMRWNEQEKAGSSLERFTYGVRVLRSGLYAIDGQAGYEIASSSQTFRSITSLCEVSASGSRGTVWAETRGERALAISTPAVTYAVTHHRWIEAGTTFGMSMFQQGQTVIAPYVNSVQSYLRVTRII